MGVIYTLIRLVSTGLQDKCDESSQQSENQVDSCE